MQKFTFSKRPAEFICDTVDASAEAEHDEAPFGGIGMPIQQPQAARIYP